MRMRIFAFILGLSLAVAACGNDTTPPAADMAPAAGDLGAGKLAFGAMCNSALKGADCQSGLCEGFAMQTVHRCTAACTSTDTSACVNPPSDGTCTPNSYCKFDN